MSIWKRKITKTGPQSRGITLPKPWLKDRELTTEDSLTLKENGNSLVIETDLGDGNDL